MRLVLDTNTVVSGLLWKGGEHRLVAMVRDRNVAACYSSAHLVAELADVLSRGKLARAVAASGLSSDELMSRYLDVVRIVVPAEITVAARADRDDDHVLACALGAQADLIVSGDSDLLNLKSYQGIAIVDAAEALARIERAAKAATTQRPTAEGI